MYCTNCGAFVIDGQAFCTSCGEKLTDTPVQASADASAAGSAAPSPVPSAGVSAQPSNAYAYGAPAAQNPPQPAASYSYGSAAPQQPAAGYGYAPAAQQPAQGYAYGAQPAQSYAYTAAPQQPAQNYIYGPDDTRTPAFNWERLQPRSHPAGAGALIFALGILFAAVLMIVWGTAFLSPGGLGSDEAIVSEETKKPSGGKKETTAADDSTKEDSTKASKEETTDKATEAPTEASTKAPVQEAAPGELPASVAAKVKKNASREDYYGNYTGTLTVDTYNLKKLAETMGAPSDQMDMYEALNGQTYAVTAEYKGSYVTVVSNEFPYTGPEEAILEGPAKEEPEEGCCLTEQVMEQDGYVLKNSQQVWFLSDGSLYLMNAITASKDGEFVAGMIISAQLKPDN